MDLVLDWLDDNYLDSLLGQPAWSWLERGHMFRQAVVIELVFVVGAFLLYFSCAALNYALLTRNYGNLAHKPFPGQIAAEIKYTAWSMPFMGLLTVPFILGEVRGYSKLYGPGSLYSHEDYGLGYMIFSVFAFLLFTDALIYWIHRIFHHPSIYSFVHKPHHRWHNPTPFASHAFHPIDGWGQSLPYHIFVYLFPMHKFLYLGLFVAVNVWTISIHDGVTAFPWKFINGTAHHTYHHTDTYYNYGQYLVLWDWMCGTYRDPAAPGNLLDPKVQAAIKAGKNVVPGRKYVEAGTDNADKISQNIAALKANGGVRRRN